MARKRRSAAPLQEPPRVPRGYTSSSTSGGRPVVRETSELVIADGPSGDLPHQYAHVKRDLMRIAVLGSVMFVLIYLSTLFLL